MNLTLERLSSNDQTTMGILLEEGTKFICFVCEEHSKPLPGGEVRAPAGKYPLYLRPKGTHRLDKQYEVQFGEVHKGLLSLGEVPSLPNCIIHVGNSTLDTSGCLVVGASVNGVGCYSVLSSVHIYLVLYLRLVAELKKGNKIWLTIIDRDRSQSVSTDL